MADIEANRFHSASVEPLRRPRVTAATVDEHLTALHVEQREDVAEEGDQVEGEGGVPRIERRAVPGPVEPGLVHFVFQRDFGVLVMGAGIRRRIAGRTEGRESTAKVVRQALCGIREQGSLAIRVAEMIREQLRNP